jgi:hypothetical protein
MSTDDNKAIYRQFVEEVINRHNLDRLEAFARGCYSLDGVDVSQQGTITISVPAPS